MAMENPNLYMGVPCLKPRFSSTISKPFTCDDRILPVPRSTKNHSSSTGACGDGEDPASTEIKAPWDPLGPRGRGLIE